MFKILSKIFGGKKSVAPKEGKSQATVEFDPIPDGKYLVKYLAEEVKDREYILLIFEVTFGDSEGEKIPLWFKDAKAKRVMKEASGGYISRLVFEGVSIAEKLQDIYYEHNEEFLIRTEGGSVKSVYAYNESRDKTFKNKVLNAPAYIGP